MTVYGLPSSWLIGSVLAIIVGLTFSTVWYKHEATTAKLNLENYKKYQELVVQEAKVKAEQKEKEGQENAKQIASDYASNIVAIRKYYDGMRNTTKPSTSTVSQSNSSAPRTSSGAANAIPPGPSIEEDCAVTTEMLNKLQEYYNKNVAPNT